MTHLPASSTIGRTAAVMLLALAISGCASFTDAAIDLGVWPSRFNPPLPSPGDAPRSGAVAQNAGPVPVEPKPANTIRQASATSYAAQDLVTPPNHDKSQISEPSLTTTDPEKEETKPTKPVVELRGRIQAEAALISQSNRDSTIIGTVEDGVGFRRARLGAQGNVGEQVRWVAEFDFAGGNVNFRDVYIALTELPVVRELRIGNFCEQFSLEGTTSSNYITFVERSPADVFDPNRHWGVGIFSYTDSERATIQAGIFRSGSNNTGNDISNARDMQYTARFTALPWYEEDTLDGSHFWHVGCAFSQQYAKNNTITYNQGPQSSLITDIDNPGSPFEPSITLTASQQQLYNVQTALVLGALTFQAEWSLADIEQLTGGPVVFNGGYVQASYFLTGEHREYLAKEGRFGPVHVHSPFWCMKGARGLGGGTGAWEVAARFSYANFVNSNLPLVNEQQQGSRNAESTLGINWYLNDNTRFMFNWVHAVPVVPGFGPSFADAFFTSSQIFW